MLTLTSPSFAYEGYENLPYICDANDNYPECWIYNYNGNNAWVMIQYPYLDLNGFVVYGYDLSNPNNVYEYYANIPVTGTFYSYDSATEEYTKFESDPYIYLGIFFNEPKEEVEDPADEVVATYDVTVYNDEVYYYPDYNDYDTYTEKVFKPFNAKLEEKADGSYTLKGIFGTDYSISYTVGKYNPKHIALVTFIDNIKADAGYENYPYFMTPNGKYMSVPVEDEETGEQMTVKYLSGNQGTDYSYVQKCTEAEIAEGYDEYYVTLGLSGFIGDKASVDMYVWFGYNTAGSSVAGVEASDNAPVEYYNLNGQRVTEPSNGIFIRRQGTKTTKIAIK